MSQWNWGRLFLHLPQQICISCFQLTLSCIITSTCSCTTCHIITNTTTLRYELGELALAATKQYQRGISRDIIISVVIMWHCVYTVPPVRLPVSVFMTVILVIGTSQAASRRSVGSIITALVSNHVASPSKTTQLEKKRCGLNRYHVRVRSLKCYRF